MSSRFAMYTERILKALPHWFKMKKDSKNSIGANFLNITGLELDNVRYALDYAYNQTKIELADIDFIDVTYKTILPMGLDVTDIESITSSTDILTKANNLAHFFGIELDGIEYPEAFRNNLYFLDEQKNILYVRNPYDPDVDNPHGVISFTIKGVRYSQSLVLHHVWNFFDEFGLLLDCPRLVAETNKEYKKRILDVFKNPAGASKQGLLNGLARELSLRTDAVWEDGSRDFIIDLPMVTLNSIKVDGVDLTENDVFITADNSVVIPGNLIYEGDTREVTYVSGIEMHQLHDKSDIKLYNELFNVDGSATDLLRYYAEKIHGASPIMWGRFKWGESYWDINDKELGGLAFIPNLYDAHIKGMEAYNPDVVVSDTATITGISVAPSDLSIQKGFQGLLTTVAHYSDGRNAVITNLANYSSSDPSVADWFGISVYGKAIGSTILTVEYEGHTATSNVTVTAPLVYVKKLTTNPSFMFITKGDHDTIMAIASSSDGSTVNVTNVATYTSSNPAVCVCSNGVISGLSQGSAIITASYEGRSVTVAVTVTAVTVTSISVAPSSLSIGEGEEGGLVVTAHYSDGTTEVVTTANYSSNNPAIASWTGTAFKGEKAGSTVGVITYEGKSASVPIAVKAATVTSLQVSPSSLNFVEETYSHLIVTATWSSGATTDVTNLATYSSSNSTVAHGSGTVGSFYDGAYGGILAQSAGSTTITVAYNGKSANIPVTVTAKPVVVNSISSDKATLSITKSLTSPVVITANWSNGTTTNVSSLATYTTSNASVATCTNGVITGVSEGSATITVSYNGKTTTIAVTVIAVTVSSFVFNPATYTVNAGSTTVLTAKVTLTDGSVATGVDFASVATLTSSNTSVCTVDANGTVHGISAGSATITGKLKDYPTITATATITVAAAAVTSMNFVPATLSTKVGNTTQLAVNANASDGTSGYINWTLITLTSSNTAVCTVSATGVLTSIAAGSATITATLKSNTAIKATTAVTVTVAAPTLTGIEFRTSTSSSAMSTFDMALNHEFKGLLVAVYSDGSATPIEPAAINGSDDTVMQLGTTGEVGEIWANPRKLGTSTITATYGGKSASIIGRVIDDPLTLQKIEFTRSFEDGIITTHTVTSDTTDQLWVYARYANGVYSNVSRMARITVANEAVASVIDAWDQPNQLAILPRGIGSTTVTASFEDARSGVSKTASLTITVEATAYPVTSHIEFRTDPQDDDSVITSFTMSMDTEALYVPVLVNSNGTTVNISSLASYSSTNESKIQYTYSSEETHARPVAIGSSTLTASYGGKSATLAGTVASSTPAIQSLRFTRDDGQTALPYDDNNADMVGYFDVYAVYANGVYKNVSDVCTVTPTDATVVTISRDIETGQPPHVNWTPKKVGMTELTASYGGRSCKMWVEATPIPV